MTSLLDVTPDGVRDGAASCRALGDRARALGHLLEQVVAGRWEGPAGRAFGDRVGEHLPFVRGAADRLVATAGILLRLAEAMDELQRRHLVAQEAWAAPSSYAEQLRLVLRTSELADAEAGALHRELLDHEEQAARAQAAMAAVDAEWEAVQRSFAAELRAVAHDGIRDDDGYRRWHWAQRRADDVAVLGLVPGPQQTVTVPASAFAATTSTAMSVGFRVAYGEGTWRGIAGDLALGRLRTAAKVLRYGATALPRNGLAPERLTVVERLAAGSRATAGETYLGRRVPASPGASAKVVNPPPTGPWLRRTLATARARAAEDFATRYGNDLAVATRGGQDAKRLLLTSWAADGVAKGVAGTGQAVTARERLRTRRQEQERAGG